ncbi:hypothetical protein BJ980_001603 [Nocardioides daedukensis]|uniref:Uncharacterized protein n=1 Tax=Nocardioides daedukensis TaxID=634462 RepID=A0A7Y9UVS2_9ACTN|nr:hypothetical protein [Nocardioides daedukensis]NYG58680.1 hypothetical protein [Nocardioides daedukensis]
MNDPRTPAGDGEVEEAAAQAPGPTGAGAADAESTSVEPTAESNPGEPTSVEPDWKRRKRLAEVFGEALPEVSREERAREGGDRKGTPDDWFRSQVPPHHG